MEKLNETATAMTGLLVEVEDLLSISDELQAENDSLIERADEISSQEQAYVDSYMTVINNNKVELDSSGYLSGYDGPSYLVATLADNPFIMPFVGIALFFMVIRALFHGRWEKGDGD